MQEDIIINGVSVNELKRQRAAIKEGASEIIAQNIDLAQELTQQLVTSDDKEQIKNLAKQAYEALDTANVVAGVSGVTFCLPYYEEYGGYSRSEILSRVLEDNDNELINEVWDEGVNKLYDLFYDMESQSRDWYSSTC